jgi:hypothetical protein
MDHTRREWLLSVGSFALFASRAWVAPGMDAEINAASYGVRADGSDAGPGFAKAIAELKRRGGGRLTIPAGVYDFMAKAGVALAFDNLPALEIDASGVEFLFRGEIRPFIFTKCQKVRIRGLTISWKRVPFSQGDVESVGVDGKSAVVLLDAITPIDGWSKVEAIGEYERSSGLIARNGLDVYNAVASVAAADARRVALGFKRSIPLKRGTTLVLRHALYDSLAMKFVECSDVQLNGVTVHSAPGMAIVGNRCSNITLTGCRVMPRPGSRLLMSTNADAVHFDDCDGYVVIEDCRFARMGDDGVNVTSSYRRILERLDDRTVVLTNRGNAPFQAMDAPFEGDAYEFASGSTLESRGNDEVLVPAPVIPSAPVTRETLHFAHNLPPGVQVGDVVIDTSRTPRLSVRNCAFDGNRARGVLAHNNATIENCIFRHQSAQGVLLSPDLYWMEGPEVSNVRIANNVFDDVDRWGRKLGAIDIDAVVIGPNGQSQTSSGYPNHAIEIGKNDFLNMNGPTVVKRATK